MPDIDYGPMQQLIGTWRGQGGLDIAPEPDGSENNPYYETIIFKAYWIRIFASRQATIPTTADYQLEKPSNNDRSSVTEYVPLQ